MKKLISVIAAICLSACACMSFAACGEKNASGGYAGPDAGEYSIITKLDLSVGFDGDTAVAKVKNTFTFFPATARVSVYLYYSETQKSYTEMQEVATGYTEDLDQGKTLTASWDTQGRGGYFLARMRYKIDGRDWEERVTEVYEREYTKAVLEPIADDGSLPVFEDIEPFCPYFLYQNDYEKIFEYTYLTYDATTVFDEFANAYQKEFNKSLDNNFYTFGLKSNEYFADPNYLDFYLLKDENNFYFYQDIILKIPELGYTFSLPDGDPPPTGLDIWWNLGLNFTFVNIEEVKPKGKLKLKFCKDDGWNYRGYINIYIGNFGIGTCSYYSRAEKEITYAFFYNLFAENLTILK